MSIKENPRKYCIYNKTTRQWTEVTDNIYRDHMRFHDAFRKRAQSHGQCVCPKNKFWLCDADCYTCEYQRAGDKLSLDFTTSNADGEAFSSLNESPSQDAAIDDIVTDIIILQQLLKRLDELMPEAAQIGELRLNGLSDGDIAKEIGIKRTTFRSRLQKTKAILQKDFPECF